VIADYDAESAVERELVLRLASILWRLRRATGIESTLFERAISEQYNPVPADTFNHDTKLEIGDRFTRLTDLPTFPLDRLSRYEHLLWRQARQLVFTLESLRRRTRPPRHSSFPFSFHRNGR
jgi:hypothetical protein